MKNLFVADFETLNNPNFTYVWCWALSTIEDNPTTIIGNTLDDFMNHILIYRNPTIFFHNLKFDGEFIVYWLEQHNYHWSSERKEGCYNILISRMNVWYKLDLYLKIKGHNVLKISFQDSLKKIPFKVEVIAGAFNLSIKKGCIDYNLQRSEKYELTIEEAAYVANDSLIVAQALHKQFSEGLEKMTIGADALHFYTISNYGSKKIFRKMFPELALEVDHDIRQSYKGGFTYLNPKYANKILNGIRVFDVNSLYPWTMYYKLLPVGEPVFFDGKYQDNKTYPLYVQHIKCMFQIKKDHIPMIQLKGNLLFSPTEYITTTGVNMVDLYLTNVDLDLFYDQYEILDIEYIDGYAFKGVKGLFCSYIDHWMDIKKNNKGAKRTLAKLMLNSLYGKFGKNCDTTGKHPVMMFDGQNEIIQYIMNEEDRSEPCYIPMATFITAYAREKTVRAAQKCYPYFIYADTDSLHLRCDDIPEFLDVDCNELGYWDNEANPDRGLFLRPKTYLEEINGKLNVKCAGMPDNVKEKVTFENFHIGSKFHGKLQPKHVPGGVVLEETDFTIL